MISGWQGYSQLIRCLNIHKDAVYPLVDGTISGLALSGTIHHGLGAPHVTDNGNYAFSFRGYYGSTIDERDFYIEQRGVGICTTEQTWMVYAPTSTLL